MPTPNKIIALTIDDAPSEYTRGILEVLKENEATATFFVIGGQVHGRERILEDMVNSGMELGNHAMHDEPSRSLSPTQLGSEMREVEGSINGTYASVGLEDGLNPCYGRCFLNSEEEDTRLRQ